MDVVHEVNTQDSHLQHQLSVVGVGAPVLPNSIMVHVPKVDDVSVGREGGGMKE